MMKTDRPQACRRAWALPYSGTPAPRWILLALVTAWGCLPPQDVQCTEDSNCNRFAGGACRSAPSGHRWCSYPDSACSSGYRYSDLDVGDGLSAECTGFDLTISVEGDGAGAVSSMPGDLVCSSGTCTRSFAEGTRIELAAEAKDGAFLGWSQVCQGPGACTMVMDRDRSATALFGTPGHARWVQQLGGIGGDSANGVATDGDGNVIAVGHFSDSIRIGATTLTSAGGGDVFVIKLHGITGEVIWAKSFGGLGDEGGSAVRTDALNNVYVMGKFIGNVDFGGGEMGSIGGQDLFVLKLNPNGDHVWSRQFGGNGDQLGHDLAIRGNAIAISGVRTQGYAIGGMSPQNLGYLFNDIYVLLLTLDGELIWSKTLGGPGPDAGLGIALDSSGNVVVVGEFEATVDFGGGPLTSADNSWDVFVVKYAGATGAHLFSKSYGGTRTDAARSVVVDSMDNIIVVGYFESTVDFGGPVPLTAANNYGDIFVAKYTLAGAHLWAESFHATGVTGHGYQFPSSVVVDHAGAVMITGQFCGTISFGGDEISSANGCLMSGGSAAPNDIFAARLESLSGGHVSSVRAASRAEPNHSTVAADGRLYLVGHFDRFAEIGGAGLMPVSGTDAFILALAPL